MERRLSLGGGGSRAVIADCVSHAYTYTGTGVLLPWWYCYRVDSYRHRSLDVAAAAVTAGRELEPVVIVVVLVGAVGTTAAVVVVVVVALDGVAFLERGD
jgi:hypothetical protein